MQRSPAAGGPKWRRLLVLDRRSAAPSPGRPPGEEGPGAAPGRKGIRGRAPGRAWTPPCITAAFPSRSRPLSWESSLLPARRAIVCDCELSSSDHVYKWDPGTKPTLTDRYTLLVGPDPAKNSANQTHVKITPDNSLFSLENIYSNILFPIYLRYRKNQFRLHHTCLKWIWGNTAVGPTQAHLLAWTST